MPPTPLRLLAVVFAGTTLAGTGLTKAPDAKS
jgi:hypothetical protein